MSLQPEQFYHQGDAYYANLGAKRAASDSNTDVHTMIFRSLYELMMASP